MTEYEFMTAKRNGFALCGKRRLNSSLMILHWMVLKLDGRQGLDVNVLALTRVFDLDVVEKLGDECCFRQSPP
jgi:hypothetical protein